MLSIVEMKSNLEFLCDSQEATLDKAAEGRVEKKDDIMAIYCGSVLCLRKRSHGASWEQAVVLSDRLLKGSLYHEVRFLFVPISVRSYTKIIIWKLWDGIVI
jgi:hypothetical protein